MITATLIQLLVFNMTDKKYDYSCNSGCEIIIVKPLEPMDLAEPLID